MNVDLINLDASFRASFDNFLNVPMLSFLACIIIKFLKLARSRVFLPSGLNRHAVGVQHQSCIVHPLNQDLYRHGLTEVRFLLILG